MEMKFLITILGSFVFLEFASLSILAVDGCLEHLQSNEMVMNISMKCASSLNLSITDLMPNNTEELSKIPGAKCMSKCLLEEFGSLDSKGRPDVKKMKRAMKENISDKKLLDKFEDVAEDCEDLYEKREKKEKKCKKENSCEISNSGDDMHCEMLQEFQQCLHKGLRKLCPK